MTYYNEWHKPTAQWLENLVNAGQLPHGVVSREDIRNVRPEDVAKTSHFFAGIGGWPLALEWAGYGDLECWTGSTPCQPFSVAGRREGFEDPRDLWPVWRALIEECRPPIIFGEQSASRGGRAWLSRLRAEMEALGYRVGAADLCAAGAGAPHLRQRIFFGAVADTYDGRERNRHDVARSTRETSEEVRKQRLRPKPKPGQPTSRVADSNHSRPGVKQVEGAPPKGPRWERGIPGWRGDVVACRDQKWRPIEPGTWPLAHGVPHRLELIRGYGNTIVPQLGAHFVRAFMKSVQEAA